MPGKKEAEEPRYMRLEDVAQHLGYKSRGSVLNLIYAGDLLGVNVSSKGSALRVTRKSFLEYCDRIEREAAERFGGAA